MLVYYWANIKPTLVQCIVSAGQRIRDADPVFIYCWANVADQHLDQSFMLARKQVRRRQCSGLGLTPEQ